MTTQKHLFKVPFHCCCSVFKSFPTLCLSPFAISHATPSSHTETHLFLPMLGTKAISFKPNGHLARAIKVLREPTARATKGINITSVFWDRLIPSSLQ